jgi:hypothetical protein
MTLPFQTLLHLITKPLNIFCFFAIFEVEETSFHSWKVLLAVDTFHTGSGVRAGIGMVLIPVRLQLIGWLSLSVLGGRGRERPLRIISVLVAVHKKCFHVWIASVFSEVDLGGMACSYLQLFFGHLHTFGGIFMLLCSSSEQSGMPCVFSLVNSLLALQVDLCPAVYHSQSFC